jgi:anti-sigma factor RsiW
MVEYPMGWTCGRVTLKLEFYLVGSLPHAEALAVAEHIEACVSCAQRLALLGPPVRAARHG